MIRVPAFLTKLGGRMAGRPNDEVALRSHNEDWLRERPFWQANPYQGRLSLSGVNWRTAIDFDLNILYHRIPKCANSALTATIAELAGGQSALSQSARRSLREELTNPSALNAEQVKAVPGLFKFVFVRNPYVRVLSAYLSKVVPERADKPHTPCSAESACMPNWQPGKPPNFADFCRYLANGGLCCKHPWAPQNEFLVFPPNGYDFIGRIETIDEDFRSIVKMLGRDPVVASVQREDPGHATGAGKNMAQYYTPELLDLVYRTYEADFDTFSYPRTYP